MRPSRIKMHNRTVRLRTILDLVRRRRIQSQAELKGLLAHGGHAVDQATLSRDLRDMGLVKGPNGYELPRQLAPRQQGPSTIGLVHALREWLDSVAIAQNLLVVKTPAGGASPLAVAIDGAGVAGVVGTVAGDDTILIVCPDARRAKAVARQLTEWKAAR